MLVLVQIERDAVRRHGEVVKGVGVRMERMRRHSRNGVEEEGYV
jgi:hypothetical protein